MLDCYRITFDDSIHTGKHLSIPSLSLPITIALIVGQRSLFKIHFFFIINRISNKVVRYIMVFLSASSKKVPCTVYIM